MSFRAKPRNLSRRLQSRRHSRNQPRIEALLRNIQITAEELAICILWFEQALIREPARSAKLTVFSVIRIL